MSTTAIILAAGEPRQMSHFQPMLKLNGKSVIRRQIDVFRAAGQELHLVGGSVRDALIGRLGNDLDFTTPARPDEIERLLREGSEQERLHSAAFPARRASILRRSACRSDNRRASML